MIGASRIIDPALLSLSIVGSAAPFTQLERFDPVCRRQVASLGAGSRRLSERT
jgi:hypothetical protein